MGITYTDKKKFTKERTRQLFRSVGWVSGKYPERLHKALMGSSTVFSAWDGDRLVGLVRVLDDTEMVAYMHYVLVDPEYQGYGIAGHLVVMVKEKYCDYLYIEVMPEESKNATFYQKHGFSIMEDGVAMQIRNPGERAVETGNMPPLAGISIISNSFSRFLFCFLSSVRFFLNWLVHFTSYLILRGRI